VERVVLDYATATPEHEHHVLFSVDESCHDPAWEHAPAFASVSRVTGRLPGFARAVVAGVRRVRPDVVHAHSSVAGGVTRALVRRTPVVYTPHCYAFLREDVGPVARRAFRAAERLLARRTSALAACSPHEAALGRELVPDDRVHHVPNLAARREPRTVETDAARPLHIVTSGRVSAQKGVAAYAALATALGDLPVEQRPEVRMTWIGGGDEELTARLRAAGVTVTGWLAQERALDVLADADLYVHCALWEAAPLTVLEAAQADVPVIARDGAPLRALGLTALWSTPAELLTLVRAFHADPAAPALHATNRSLRERHTPAAQTAALRACYTQVAGPGLPTSLTHASVRRSEQSS
jgi:glycosyltransferase involved in cell wall biosynthesis